MFLLICLLSVLIASNGFTNELLNRTPLSSQAEVAAFVERDANPLAPRSEVPAYRYTQKGLAKRRVEAPLLACPYLWEFSYRERPSQERCGRVLSQPCSQSVPRYLSLQVHRL